MNRKKVLAYSSSATGSAKLEEISAAYVEIIEDFQQKALQQGSEDPASAEMLQKCEEMLPGQVRELFKTLYLPWLGGFLHLVVKGGRALKTCFGGPKSFTLEIVCCNQDPNIKKSINHCEIYPSNPNIRKTTMFFRLELKIA